MGEGLAVLVAVCECFGVSVAVGGCFLAPVRVGVGVGDDVDFALGCGADGVALSEALGVLVLVADADGLAYEVLLEDVGVVADSVGEFVGVSVGVCDGVADGLDVSVWVGAGVVSDGVGSDGVVSDGVVSDGDGSDGVVPELVGPDGDGLADSLALALVDAVGGGLVVVSVGGLAVGA